MAERAKYLRCAVVWEHTLLDERVFAPGERVTVGASHRAAFTLPAAGTGRSLTVLRPDADGATLRLVPGMLGRVQIGGRPVEVADLANDHRGLASRRGDAVEYRLAPGDGGVLVFGDAGLAFDFVDPPRPLPPARLGQLLDADPNINKLFGGGVLVIALLALVSRLFATPPGEFTIEQLPDRFVSFVTDDAESAKALRRELERRREKKAERQKQQPEDKPAERDEPRRKRVAAAESPDQRELRRIRDKVARKGVVGAIGRARKRDRALAQVLDESGLDLDLGDALAQLDRNARARVIGAKGGDSASADPLVSARRAGDSVGRDQADRGPRTGRTGRRAARRSRLAGRQPAAIELRLPAAAARVTGGRLSKAAIAKVVQSNKGAIRYCYESKLTRYPTLQGKVVVDFIIEPDGSVRTVKIGQNKLRPRAAGRAVASCLIRFIKRWTFPSPEGGKVRVIYPFTFGRSR